MFIKPLWSSFESYNLHVCLARKSTLKPKACALQHNWTIKVGAAHLGGMPDFILKQRRGSAAATQQHSDAPSVSPHGFCSSAITAFYITSPENGPFYTSYVFSCCNPGKLAGRLQPARHNDQHEMECCAP